MRNQRTSVEVAAVILYMVAAVLFCSVVTIKDVVENRRAKNKNEITNVKNWERRLETAFHVQ